MILQDIRKSSDPLLVSVALSTQDLPQEPQLISVPFIIIIPCAYMSIFLMGKTKKGGGKNQKEKKMELSLHRFSFHFLKSMKIF